MCVLVEYELRRARAWVLRVSYVCKVCLVCLRARGVCAHLCRHWDGQAPPPPEDGDAGPKLAAHLGQKRVPDDLAPRRAEAAKGGRTRARAVHVGGQLKSDVKTNTEATKRTRESYSSVWASEQAKHASSKARL